MKTIDGKYDVLKTLGAGMSGEVFLVRDPQGRSIALKFLKQWRPGADEAEALASFKREFSILKDLNHPNIARILDFGRETLPGGGGRYYFTAEFVEGADFFKATDGKEVEAVEELVVQALRALEYLHARGIYHLDVKPANLLVTKDGKVKLIDFGLAGERFGDKIAGTPSYMAPEVLYGDVPDGRADLYSLGVVFYYALARGNPFRGPNVPETLERHKKLVPPPVSTVRADVPEYLDRVLTRFLEKKRGDRYLRASHIIRDINLLSGRNYPVETAETLLSYLPEEGAFIGREKELAAAQEFCRNAKRGVLRIEGAKGAGKTRFCQELKYFCQLNELKVVLLDDFENWSAADKESGFETLQTALETETIVLGNLSKEEVGHYITSLTGAEAPEMLTDALFARTDGNPLFLSEILKALIARGLLFDAQGRWRRQTLDDIGVDFSRLAIPKTLKDLFKKAYAEETPGVRSVLSLLALLKRPVTADALEILAEAETETFSNDLLALIRKGWAVRDPLTGNVSLKNPLWHEVIAEDLDPRVKAALHDRVAAWLEKAGRLDEAAVHWGDGSDAEKACLKLPPLARSLVEKGRGAEAIPLFEKVLARLPARPPAGSNDPRVLINLWMELGEATLQADDYAASLRVFQKIHPMLSRIENRDEDILYKADIHERLASVALKLKRTEEAKSDIQAGLTLLTDYRADFDDGAVRRMILENDLGEAWCQEGRLDRAEEIFLKTRFAWEKLPPKDRTRITNNDLGFLYLLKGEAEKAVAFLKKELRFFEALPRRYPEARCHYNLAEAHFGLKDYQRTIVHYEKCVALAKEIRAYDLLLRAYNGLGNVHAYHAEKKNIEAGIEYYLRALSIAQKLDDLSSQAAIHSNLGILYQEDKRASEAEHHLIGAIRILHSLDEKSAYDVATLARTHLELGSLLRERRDFEKARDHLRDAERLAGEHAALKSLRFWVFYEFARLYKDQGQTKALADQVKKLREAASTPEEVKKVRELEDISRDRIPTAPSEGETPPWKGLVKVLRFLNTERDLAFLLKNILHYALDLSGAETGLILDAAAQPDGVLGIRSALSASVDPELSRFSNQVAQRVLKEGRAVATNDAQEDPRFSEARSVHLLKLRSIVALPIAAPGRGVWGVLYLDTRIQSVPLHRAETLEILQAFADQAGLAIENARLFEETEAARKNVQNELNRTQDELSLTKSLLQEETQNFKTRYSYRNIVTRAKPMRDLFRMLDKVTDTPLAVLIRGETGTGKELVARALHYNGSRKSKNFVAVNCGAIPSELMESELFGHKAGAFTGALRDKVGLCEAADGGTLFLDEVGELSPALQVKLLRFVQEKEFRRVGDTETRKVDVRIVSATHQDLEARIVEGKFREDLYFRLCEVPVSVPALRERREDIPVLAEHFLEEYRQETKAAKKLKLDKSLLRRMIEYDWPGNVRELESFLRVACALAENATISAATLPSHSPLAGRTRGRGETLPVLSASKVLIDGANPYRPALTWLEYEKRFMAQAYRHHRFKAIPTAKAVGLTPPTLYRKIKEWKLEEPENPLYRDPFEYKPQATLEDFCKKVFQAALKHHQRPYAALRALGVSQGYFYKVIKT